MCGLVSGVGATGGLGFDACCVRGCLAPFFYYDFAQFVINNMDNNIPMKRSEKHLPPTYSHAGERISHNNTHYYYKPQDWLGAPGGRTTI